MSYCWSCNCSYYYYYLPVIVTVIATRTLYQAFPPSSPFSPTDGISFPLQPSLSYLLTLLFMLPFPLPTSNLPNVISIPSPFLVTCRTTVWYTSLSPAWLPLHHELWILWGAHGRGSGLSPGSPWGLHPSLWAHTALMTAP